MRRVIFARLALLFVLGLCASCRDANQPAAPRSLSDAAKRFDEAINTLNWAQQDLYTLGGRDIVVSVQIDSSLAPHYFRLPRKAR